ncbi:hypothetical protein ACQP3L_37785, partial [Escherichia coli]
SQARWQEREETCSLAQSLETREARQPLALILWILELKIRYEGIISEAETLNQKRRWHSL